MPKKSLLGSSEQVVLTCDLTERSELLKRGVYIRALPPSAEAYTSTDS